MELKFYKNKILPGLLTAAFIVLVFQEKAKVLNYPPNQILDFLPKTDCGVVLTGAPGRIREAFEVFAQKKFDKLIISGVYKDTQLHEIFPQLAFYPEINPENIVLEKISGSTYGNAVQSLLVAETLKCKSLLLMTSDLHMHRAYRMFKAGFPGPIKIEKYHIKNSAKGNSFFDIYLETVKSIFYNVIIYFVSLMA